MREERVSGRGVLLESIVFRKFEFVVVGTEETIKLEREGVHRHSCRQTGAWHCHPGSAL